MKLHFNYIKISLFYPKRLMTISMIRVTWIKIIKSLVFISSYHHVCLVVCYWNNNPHSLYHYTVNTTFGSHTDVIVLGPKHLRNTLSNDRTALASSTTVRNLGVIFYQDFSFNSHIYTFQGLPFSHLSHNDA